MNLILVLSLLSAPVCEFKVSPECKEIKISVDGPIVSPTPIPTPPPTPTPVPTPSPTPPPTPNPGSTFLKSGDDLAKAISQAKEGDTIVLQAAGKFKGNLIANKKNLLIRGEKLDALLTRKLVKNANGVPYFKQEINEEFLGQMPVIESSGNVNMIFAADGMKIKGVRISGGGQSGAASIANDLAPNRCEFDRSGFVAENSVFENTRAVGFAANCHNYVLKNVICRNNGAAGCGGSRGDGGLFEDVLIYGNNKIEKKGDGGGGKVTRSDKMTMRYVESYDNLGPGIWFDIWNTNSLVEFSSSHDNIGTPEGRVGKGIMLELSNGDKSGKQIGVSIIRNNVIFGNDQVSGRERNPQRGLLISSSPNTQAINNTISDDVICIKDGNGNRELQSKNILLKNNKLSDGAKVVYDNTSKSDVKDDNNGAEAPGAGL